MSRPETAERPDPCPICGEALQAQLQQSPARLARWAALPRLALQRGQVLLRAGDRPAALWWVEQGLLRASLLDAHGRERTLAFYREQQWMGLPGEPTASTVTLEALEPSRVCALPYAELQHWQAEEPALAELLWQGLNAQLQSQLRREQQWLMLDAGQRYQRFLAEEPELAGRLKQRLLASHLGITDVALSRIRRRLRAQGLLKP